MKSVVITKSGRITLPAEIRRKHGWKTGDRVLVSENARGEVVLIRMPTFEELTGIFKLPPGVVTDDFDDLIEEAFEEGYARKAAEMRSGHEAEYEQGGSDGLTA